MINCLINMVEGHCLVMWQKDIVRPILNILDQDKFQLNQRLKSKNNVTNMLEENVRQSFHNLGIGKSFQIMTQDRGDSTENKQNYMTLGKPLFKNLESKDNSL